MFEKGSRCAYWQKNDPAFLQLILKNTMKINSLFLFPAILSVLVISCNPGKSGTNYYFDVVKGNDGNTGTSPDKPFKSLAMIRHLTLKPGDSVLLKSGEVFNDTLFISCKGDSAKPVVLGKYGGNARPYIRGNGNQPQTVHVYNCEHFVIRDLEISNTVSEPADKIHGLLVEQYNYGTGRDITIENLYVHDVKGQFKDKDKINSNAIAIVNYRDNKTDSISSHFDGLLVQNCLIKNCDYGGIGMWGNWERKRWNPNLHVVIRHNVIDGISGHGIVPVACEAPLVEYNVIKNAPQLPRDPAGVDGIWPWSCDNAVVQYNVVSDLKSQWDAYGYDADYNCQHSLFQYNLSFNNIGGFLLVCNSGGWPKDWSVGNTGSVIKYNVSINDGLRNYIGDGSKRYFSPVIHCTGSIRNSLIEKNLFYVFPKPDPKIDKTIIDLDNWGKGYFPDSTAFRNNFIYVEEPNLAVNAENSSRNFFDGNLYLGDLKTPAAGFVKYKGKFDKDMWYNRSDPNWNKLVGFLKDKTVKIDGKELKVLDIIGFNN
jgi:hypothetical protein